MLYIASARIRHGMRTQCACHGKLSSPTSDDLRRSISDLLASRLVAGKLSLRTGLPTFLDHS